MVPLSIRAALESVNEETRTVDLVFSTGAAVERMDFWTGKRYIETLSLEPAHVRLERLNDGGPLLDAHGAWSVSDQLGAVVPGSVSLMKKEARARVQFSKRAAVEEIWQDVRDGLIRSVSVGYRVYKVEETEGKGNALPVRRAIDWEPFEISMVPIPADAGAKVRDGKSDEANVCEIVPPGYVARAAGPVPAAAPAKTPVAAATTTKETLMEDRSETIMDPGDTPLAPAKPAKPAEPAEPNERDAGVTAERVRVEGIRNACLAARLPRSFEDKLIKEGTPLVDAQGRVFDELRKRTDPNGAPSPAGASGITVGDDPMEHKRKAIEGALLHRLAPDMFKLDPEARQYRGMGLLDIGDVFLRAQGVRIMGMTKMERAGAVLGLATRVGMHTITDFPLLLADVANKVLRAAYEAAPQTWLPLAKAVPLSDFKASNQLQVGTAPALLEVLEHGEFTRGTIAEAKEAIQLKTYGRVFAITRQALINDDTGAFAEVPASFGRSARNKESDLAWAQITSNPAMGDGVVLFHATHGNLAGAAAAISIDAIGIGRAALRKMKDIDAATILNLSPNFLLVPAAKETIADQFVSTNLMASGSSAVNPFAGRLQVISEPRLDVASATAWYLATNVAQCPVLLYGTLDGQPGPQIDQQLGFDVDGLQIKCRLDVAFKAADWHGIFRNDGA
jgi:hypothetical protein